MFIPPSMTAAVAPPRLDVPLFEDVASRQSEILRAALDLFVERGYEATSVPRVARRAGVAAGTIYLYFASKEALVNALLARIKGALASRLLAAWRPDVPLAEQFAALHGAFGRWVLEQPRASAF